MQLTVKRSRAGDQIFVGYYTSNGGKHRKFQIVRVFYHMENAIHFKDRRINHAG